MINSALKYQYSALHIIHQILIKVHHITQLLPTDRYIKHSSDDILSYNAIVFTQKYNLMIKGNGDNETDQCIIVT